MKTSSTQRAVRPPTSSGSRGQLERISVVRRKRDRLRQLVAWSSGATALGPWLDGAPPPDVHRLLDAARRAGPPPGLVDQTVDLARAGVTGSVASGLGGSLTGGGLATAAKYLIGGTMAMGAIVAAVLFIVRAPAAVPGGTTAAHAPAERRSGGRTPQPTVDPKPKGASSTALPAPDPPSPAPDPTVSVARGSSARAPGSINTTRRSPSPQNATTQVLSSSPSAASSNPPATSSSPPLSSSVSTCEGKWIRLAQEERNANNFAAALRYVGRYRECAERRHEDVALGIELDAYRAEGNQRMARRVARQLARRYPTTDPGKKAQQYLDEGR